MTIREAWLSYLEVISEDRKLCAKSNKLYAEGLYVESSRLYAEGIKLHAEGRIAFLDVIISQLGNVEIKWIFCYDSIEIAGTTYTKDLNDPWNKVDSCDGKVVEIDGKKYQLKLMEK